MKKIGIIGGSFESTRDYFERINQRVNELSGGGLIGADLMIRNINFGKYYDLVEEDDWETVADDLAYEAAVLDMCGCDYIAIASDTFHKVAHEVEGRLKYTAERFGEWSPFVHIGDCVAEECIKAGVKRIALLGTRITMTEPFMQSRLAANGLEVVDNFTDEQINRIDQLIIGELCHGIICYSAEYLRHLCQELAESGDIEGIVLGCTELNAAFNKRFKQQLAKDYGVMLFDTTQAHISKLVELCLSE